MGENGNVFVCPQVSSVNVRHTEIFSFVPVDFWPFAFILIYYLYFCTAPDKIIYISISKLITISCSDALPPSELNWCQGGQQKATEGKGLLMAVCILAQCQTRPRLPHLATNRFKLISTTIYLAITLALLSHDTPLSLYCSLSHVFTETESYIYLMQRIWFWSLWTHCKLEYVGHNIEMADPEHLCKIPEPHPCMIFTDMWYLLNQASLTRDAATVSWQHCVNLGRIICVLQHNAAFD